MVEALVLGFLLQKVAAENHAQGGAVRQIEKTQGRDRNVELYRIDRDREVAAFDAARHHGADHLDERRMHRFDLGGALEMPRPRQIFGVQQRQKFGIADEIIPGEGDQPFDRAWRVEMLKIEPTLLDADLLIGAFEHREIEIVLLADVVIQHALVGAGLRRNPVDAGAGEAMGGEFLLGGRENAKPHALGVALPFWNSLFLGQKYLAIALKKMM